LRASIAAADTTWLGEQSQVSIND